MIFGGPVCRLQTCSCLAAEWFNSTFWAISTLSFFENNVLIRFNTCCSLPWYIIIILTESVLVPYFQDILRYLREGGFTHVSAVVWNVIPNVRRDAALSKHASLIDQIAEGVWANVVVVCKQSMRPGRDGGGAAAAAREVMAEGAGEGERNVLPQVTGYRFLSDFADDAAQLDKMESDEESRRAFNVMTDPEVRSHLTGCLERCGPALELVFRDSKCLDCGAVADARLMPPLCHMESHRTHPEAAARAHPGARERYHPGETGAVHPGTLRRLWYGRLVGRRAKRFSCCGRRTGRPGCAARWRCCDRGEGEDGCESRFSCCRVDVGKEEEEEEAGLQGCQMLHPCCGRSEGRPGCEERCRKCGALWGTRAPGELEDGDGRGGGGCYRRRHNVVGQWKTEEEEEEERRRAEERKRAEREAEDRTTMGMEPMVLLKPF